MDNRIYNRLSFVSYSIYHISYCISYFYFYNSVCFRTLIQDLDVSMYGSKMGIIHGTSGEWLLNVTNSPSIAFQALNNFTNTTCKIDCFIKIFITFFYVIVNNIFIGPTKFNYTRVLETVSIYLERTWEYNYKNQIIGNFGQVVILLIPLAHMSNNEKESVIILLRQLKHAHPGKYINLKHELQKVNFNNLFFY